MPLYVPPINNLFRAWADVTTVAYGGTPTAQTVNAGLNIASVTKTSASGIEVVFTTPLPSAAYAVVVTMGAGTATVGAKTVNGFTIGDSSGMSSTGLNFVVVS